MEFGPEPYAVRCGPLFDGAREQLISDRTIVVRDGRFEEGIAEAGMPVLDLRGRFVMPGLIDAHAHLSTTPLLLDRWPDDPGPVAQALTIPGNLETALRAGTTTMRVMGEDSWLDVDARTSIRTGEIQGPNLVIATRAITASLCAEIDASDDSVGVRRLAAENFDHGADFLKIHVTEGAEGGRDALFSRAAMAAAVDEARKRNTYVSAHGHGGSGIADAIAAGVRTIEHGFELTSSDIEAMRENDTWLVSTLAFDFCKSGLESVIAKVEPDYVLEDLLRARKSIEACMRSVIEAGVDIAFGSNHLPGSMADEIRLAVEFGMPVGRALRAATSGAAALLGLSDRIGTIEPGKNADLVAFARNPFVDLDALDDVVVVIKDGVVVSRANGFVQ